MDSIQKFREDGKYTGVVNYDPKKVARKRLWESLQQPPSHIDEPSEFNVKSNSGTIYSVHKVAKSNWAPEYSIDQSKEPFYYKS